MMRIVDNFLDIFNPHLWTILLNIDKAYVEICKYI